VPFERVALGPVLLLVVAVLFRALVHSDLLSAASGRI
jgi:hypothetical protein